MDVVKTFNASSAVHTVNNTITIATHGFKTGDKVKYSAGAGTANIGLVEGTDYFVVVTADDNVFKLAESKANAIADTPTTIGLTSGADENHTLTDQELNYLKTAKVKASVTYYSDSDNTQTTVFDTETIAGRFDAKDSYTIDISQENINYTTTESGRVKDDHISKGTVDIIVHEGLDKLEAANWEIYSGSGGALPAGKFFVTFDTPVPSQWAGESDPETIVSTYFDISYDTTASVSRNTFGILLLAVYDLYFSQQFIDSSADCIKVNALS